ncbi:MAG: CsbD family protein [Actinomycetota bacterium]|nr:CsbD family protein [Actinomycetota bacterium]
MGDDKVQDLKGRAKEAAGNLTDNEDLENKGKSDQAKASVKEKVGNVVDSVKDKIDDIKK